MKLILVPNTPPSVSGSGTNCTSRYRVPFANRGHSTSCSEIGRRLLIASSIRERNSTGR